MHPLLNIAIQAARNSSKIITRCIDHIENIKITEKQRNDFVTEVDRLAEQEIIKTITKAYPSHSILAEETGLIEGDDFCWIIDPLDGTLNYIHGFPQYAISIALKHRNKLEIGLIYDPIRHEQFTAVRGKGAHLNNHRMRVTNHNNLTSALIGTGYPAYEEHAELKNYLNMLAVIIPKIAEIRHTGSAALNLAYVAAGRLDGYWEFGLKAWDMAAGILMIQEAGGMTVDFNAEANYLENGSIIAGNPKILPLLMDCIRESKSLSA
jgi:myo-inositol-1(or 4)-monophosphatase